MRSVVELTNMSDEEQFKAAVPQRSYPFRTDMAALSGEGDRVGALADGIPSRPSVAFI
jgi:hypothetical protein